MELKLIETCSPISSKHSFKKHLVLAGFQKKKVSSRLITYIKPPRSVDFNPIGNIFCYVKSELRIQAFQQSINYETFEPFYVKSHTHS